MRGRPTMDLLFSGLLGRSQSWLREEEVKVRWKGCRGDLENGLRTTTNDTRGRKDVTLWHWLRDIASKLTAAKVRNVVYVESVFVGLPSDRNEDEPILIMTACKLACVQLESREGRNSLQFEEVVATCFPIRPRWHSDEALSRTPADRTRRRSTLVTSLSSDYHVKQMCWIRIPMW